MGTGDDLERVRDRFELSVREPTREVIADPTKMGARRVSQQSDAGLGQAHDHDAGVVGSSSSFDETEVHETVDTSGQGAGWDEHARGELCHSEAVRGSAREAEQHVVRVERNPVGVPEIGVEGPGNVVVGMEERLPRPHLLVPQPADHGPPV